MINNRKHNKLIQSAGNWKGSSETTRQLSNTTSVATAAPGENHKNFVSWFAGVLDGDGNFDLRKKGGELVLKAIRIKIHCRDVRICTRIQNYLHRGRIRYDKKKPYVHYILSTRADMEYVLRLVNGEILIKCISFSRACRSLNIDWKEGNYQLDPLNHYFAGLIDTDGSIVFNFPANRIECNLELKYTEQTKKLNFQRVIPHARPSCMLRNKKITGKPGRLYKSIAFKFQTVGGMIFLYQAFMKMRLYCDFKFYRVSAIKKFLQIRHYRNHDFASVEYQIYALFLLQWIQHQNPLWLKCPFAQTLLERTRRKSLEHARDSPFGDQMGERNSKDAS